MSEEDLFDALCKLEQEQENLGYSEGESKAKRDHYKAGFILGWQQANHIQEEIFKIDGLLAAIQVNYKSELDSRQENSIAKIRKSIEEFPNWSNEESDLELKLATIFNKTKLILIKLKIPVRIIDRSIESEF